MTASWRLARLLLWGMDVPRRLTNTVTAPFPDWSGSLALTGLANYPAASRVRTRTSSARSTATRVAGSSVAGRSWAVW
jgi:hypothetical protein